MAGGLKLLKQRTLLDRFSNACGPHGKKVKGHKTLMKALFLFRQRMVAEKLSKESKGKKPVVEDLDYWSGLSQNIALITFLARYCQFCFSQCSDLSIASQAWTNFSKSGENWILVQFSRHLWDPLEQQMWKHHKAISWLQRLLNPSQNFVSTCTGVGNHRLQLNSSKIMRHEGYILSYTLSRIYSPIVYTFRKQPLQL